MQPETSIATEGAVVLPETDEDGLYEIRLESLGGLGAHLAGKMLAEAAVLHMGLNGAHFSSYGSEKKGTPISSFVRLTSADHELRTSAPVERPFIVGVFMDTLLKNPKVILSGLRPGGIIIVNTTLSPEEVRAKLGHEHDTVACLDATTIAIEEKTRVNTAMLAAVAAMVPFIEADAVRTVIAGTFERKHPSILEANLRTFDRAAGELHIDRREPSSEPREVITAKAAWGYLEAPIGGVVVNPANTVEKDLSGSRTGFLPVFHAESCIHCALCDMVCSDNCLVWDVIHDDDGTWHTQLQGIDYRYCKGCLACVDTCPPGAMTKERENPGFADEHRVPIDWAPRKVDLAHMKEPT